MAETCLQNINTFGSSNRADKDVSVRMIEEQEDNTETPQGDSPSTTSSLFVSHKETLTRNNNEAVVLLSKNLEA